MHPGQRNEHTEAPGVHRVNDLVSCVLRCALHVTAVNRHIDLVSCVACCQLCVAHCTLPIHLSYLMPTNFRQYFRAISAMQRLVVVPVVFLLA